ncbi:MAG: hypothetical protein ABJL99_26700 [Aliishimia sp.]
MTDHQETIIKSLQDIGFGPQRIKRASAGEALAGQGGLLNSIEMVQFLAALSDRTDIDAFELMDKLHGDTSVFSDLGTVSHFLDGCRVQAAAS